MEAFRRYYWRSRKYRKLKRSASGNKTGRVVRIGAARGSNRRFTLRLRSLFKIRIRVFSPSRILTRIRDAYVDAMLGLAGKGSGLSGSGGPELLLDRRIPKARPVRHEPGDFERRLILEIYKSVMTSGELAAQG